MRRYLLFAALVAMFLSGALIGCGGAEDATVTADATTASEPQMSQPTRPPPIVAANTVDPAGGETEGEVGPVATDAPGGEVPPAPALPTALPTEVPTEAPATDVPTETAMPTTPPTAAPVVVQPTAVPPTASPIPPTPAPQLGANGLIASHFALQERAQLFVDGDIWFEFTIANNTDAEVPFDALGVMPKKDGVDRPEWYQNSYGGNNDKIPRGGLSWDDHINLPEAGNYTLRMVICFDGPACRAQTGTWHTLSQEISISIARQ